MLGLACTGLADMSVVNVKLWSFCNLCAAVLRASMDRQFSRHVEIWLGRLNNQQCLLSERASRKKLPTNLTLSHN